MSFVEVRDLSARLKGQDVPLLRGVSLSVEAGQAHGLVGTSGDPTRDTAIRDELGMPVGALVVNQLLPRLFASGERASVLDLVGKLPQESPLHGLAMAGRQRAIREDVIQPDRE